MVAMSWGTRCLIVEEETQISSFSIPKRLPRGVQITGRFDAIVGLSLVYDNSSLSFETKKGNLVPLENVPSCKEV